MRFERDLYQRLVPGKEASYINYTACKRLFKSACTNASNESKIPNFEGKYPISTDCYVALTSTPNLFLALHQTLREELAKVEHCYIKRFNQVGQAVKAFRGWYGISKEYNIDESLQRVNPEELRGLVRKCFDLLSKLQEIFHYGNLNRHGFSQIYDKLEGVDPHYKDVFSALNPVRASFTSQVECLKEIESLRNFIFALWPICVSDPPYSATLSLHLKTLQRSAHSFPDCIEDLCSSIYQREATSLQQLLQRTGLASQGLDEETQPLLYDLLEYAVLCSLKNCVDVLSKYIRSAAPMDFNGTGNIFHRLTESIGLASKPMVDADIHHNEPLPVTNSTKNRAQLLSHVVHALAETSHPALDTRDCFGRLPLHYGSLYGLTSLCSAYLEHMMPSRDASSIQILQPFLSSDADEYTSLQLSVLGGHVETARSLLESLRSVTTADGTDWGDRPQTFIEEALNIALRQLSDPERSQLAQCLLSLLPKFDRTRPNCRTALYLAAQYGCQRLLEDMIEKSPDPNELLNLPHSLHGRTPLIVACVEGHLNAVKALTLSGADPSLCDSQGWTAKEHAAFRGHLDIAEWLVRMAPDERLQLRHAAAIEIESKTSLRHLPLPQRQIPTAKDKTQILLTLGPSNTRSNMQAADITPMSVRQHEPSCNDAGYALRINSIHADGPTPFIRLPTLADLINDPWWFSTDDIDRAGFVFNLVRLRNQNHEDGTLIASGVAILKDLKQGFSFKHESLNRDCTIPLLQKDSLRFAGTVTFSFLQITPLPCPNVSLETKTGFWKTGPPTQVVGHRGTSGCTMQNREVSC